MNDPQGDKLPSVAAWFNNSLQAQFLAPMWPFLLFYQTRLKMIRFYSLVKDCQQHKIVNI